VRAEKKIVFEKECQASWQVSSIGGTLFKIKCRNCGVMISSGGAPKCLHPKHQEDKITFTRSKRVALKDFIKDLFKTD